ncbi:MAG: CPBP family intramembrane metalloprotease [Muribaculaceae bacterium]|nr:CPBP family intramembrane metalloprotease [Muribaculaceae bacterium]
MKEPDKKLETTRILLFLGITFCITYCYCFFVIYPMLQTDNVREGTETFSTLIIAAAMFFPAIGVFLTRLITKEGFQNAWLRPHFKGNLKTYLLAYFGPGILTILGSALYFLIFPGSFDSELGYLQTTLEGAGANPEMYPVPLSTQLIMQALMAFFLGPIMNFFTCFGEEWGWRGYLLPKMAKKLPALPMLLINGIIWGLWHAPLTAIGHNYGVGYWGFPFTGIAAMCLFCIVMGIFLSYVSMKTQSCIPAILGHGAINSFAAIGIYFTTDGGNPFIGPAPTGIIGAIPFIITTVIILVFYFRNQQV